MIPTPKLAELVLKQDAERAEVQEKLVALVTCHHEELGALLKTLPDLKREALENINARLEVVVAEALQKSLAAVAEKEAAVKADLGALANSAVQAAEQVTAQAKFDMAGRVEWVESLIHNAQATRDQINELLARLDQRQTESLTALARSLSPLAEKKAREVLASDETQEIIRAAFVEHSKPILAALESKGGSFIDLYQGEFIAGKSTALRGQIWTYFGNTLLCTADTNQAPQYYDLSDSWALLAAKGAGGASGGGGGSSLPDQTGNSGKFLTTDGTDPSWATLAGGGDMLSTNNLSDVANAVTAFTNIKQAATEAATGVVELATSAETDAGKAVQASDTRLSDARTPTDHAATHVTGGGDTIADAVAAGNSGLMSGADKTKLDGIEAGADVTDATNVAAAGALMESALGTGVETALGIAVGTAGAPVVLDGAGGTPSSLDLTNATAYPVASTSRTGATPQATAPAAGLLSVLAIANTETVRTDKALFDTTNPAALGSVSPGTQIIAARRDHVHAMPSAADVGALPTTGGTMTGNITQSENSAIVLDPALSADGKYCGIVQAGTAGAALAFGDLCYFAVADSRWELTDADASATAGPVKLGICVLAAAGDNTATTMLLWGKVRADTAFPTLTIGAPVYVGLTAGDVAVTETWGTDDVIRVIGHAEDANTLWFTPSNDYITYV